MYEKFQDLDRRIKLYTNHARILKIAPVIVAPLGDFRKEFEPLYDLWTTASNWQLEIDRLLRSSFTTINAEKMSQFIIKCSRTISKVLKQIPHKVAPFNVSGQLKKKIDEVKRNMPLIIKLRHPGIRTRHWYLILDDINGEEKAFNEEELTLKYVLGLQLENHAETIVNITGNTIFFFSPFVPPA